MFPWMSQNAACKGGAPRRDTVYPEDISSLSLSPELTMLLAAVLNGGLLKITFFDMLANIAPYVDPCDRAAIQKLLQLKCCLKDESMPVIHDDCAHHMSKKERMLTLLDIMMRYSTNQTQCALREMKHMIVLKHDMEHTMDKVSYYRASMQDTTDIFRTMEMVLPRAERRQLRSIANIIRVMQGGMNAQELMKMLF